MGLFLSALVLMGGALHSIRETRKMMPNPSVPAYREAAEWIRENVEAGALVFTADWDDYPFLFFFDPDHVYLVGLDPTFMYAWDAEVYAEWDRLRHGRSEQPCREIVKQFDSRIVVATKNFARLIESARSNSQVSIPVENDRLVVLDLRNLTEIPTPATCPAQP